MASKSKKPAAKPKRRTGRRKAKERIVSVLFVLLVLIALAIAFDYILFRFQMPPIFALKIQDNGCTERVGLLYVVSDYTDTDPARALEWDWIWNKFRITRID